MAAIVVAVIVRDLFVLSNCIRKVSKVRCDVCESMENNGKLTVKRCEDGSEMLCVEEY